MGWASGSAVAMDMIDILFKEVKDYESRKSIFRVLIKALEQLDWDTEDECMGIDAAFDEAMEELNPS